LTLGFGDYETTPQENTAFCGGLVLNATTPMQKHDFFHIFTHMSNIRISLILGLGGAMKQNLRKTWHVAVVPKPTTPVQNMCFEYVSWFFDTYFKN